MSTETSKTIVGKPVKDAKKQPKEVNKLVTLDDPIFKEYGQPFTISDNDKLDFNQPAIAHKFVADYGIRFDESQRRLMQYGNQTGLWSRISDNAAKGILSEFIRKLTEQCGQKTLAYKLKSTLLSSILSLVKSVATTMCFTPVKPGMVLATNGVLDLTSNKVQIGDVSPKHGFTMGCAFPYKPREKCSRFLNELLSPALEKEDISLVQRYFGSMLLGENAAQRILVIKGNPGTGKSTMVSILERIFGIEQVAYLRSQHLAGRFEFSGFLGKRLLAGKDVTEDTLSINGAKFLKSLVGGDLLEGEIKYNTTRAKITGNFHVVVTSNASLKIALDNDADAWRRRLLVVSFDKVKPAIPIANFTDQLVLEEGQGIFAWLVQGALAHRKELKKRGNYEITKDQQTRIDDMINESQSIENFVAKGVAKEKGSDLTVEELTDAYEDHCLVRKWSPVSERIFQNEVHKYMGKLHGIKKRHDIIRKDKCARGFSEVALTV